MKTPRRLGEALSHAFHRDSDAMILRPSTLWSRAILWTIVGTASIVILWACLAEMDEVVHATGKLEPIGSVLDVQAPVGGVVNAVEVKEGQTVKAGQVLIRLDPGVAGANLEALREVAKSLREEISAYDRLLATEGVIDDLPPEVAGLAKDRAALLAENKLLRAQMAFSADGVALSPDQRKLFEESEKDRTERLHQAELRARRAERDLEAAQNQLAQSIRLRDNSSQIVESYRKLVKTGGVSQVDFLAREAELIQTEAQVSRLETQISSLTLEIERAREEAKNTNTAYRKDAMARLNDNGKRLAEIESGLTRARLANLQRISEIESRLVGTSTELGYHQISAPVDGVVFEILTSKPGTVVAPKDTVMKLVPSEELVARVDITNRDIGFVHTGQRAEIQVESFPAREYGYLHGTLDYVASDALPPTQIRPFYAFSANIRLDSQSLSVQGRPIQLQSGMAVSANIHVRRRRVIMTFLDTILGPVEALERVR